MIINIKPELVETLNRLGAERSQTPETYVEEYLESHLISQYKKEVVAKVEGESLENIVLIDDAITSKKVDIENANEVIRDAIVNDTSTTTEEVIN